MVKEAVFSMLQGLVAPSPGPSPPDAPLAGKACLDLFAGTGALGIEALSRGAESCVFVEADLSTARLLRENLGAATREGPVDAVAAGAAWALRSDWRAALRRLKGGAGIDVAFVDPPYESGYYDEVMKTLRDYDIISEGGIVVLERACARKEAPVEGAGGGRYGGFTLLRARRYGRTLAEIYGRDGPAWGPRAPRHAAGATEDAETDI
jgi:16S rRNA (guanine(966)-N(2))-methyltransferase RsmD